MTKKSLSTTVIINYIYLFFRLVLLVWAFLVLPKDIPDFSLLHNQNPAVGIYLTVSWLVFFSMMLLRLIPATAEGIGCGKHLKRFFVPTEQHAPELRASHRSAVRVAISWILLNGVIAAMYFCGILSKKAVFLIALFFSISDGICMLFFCPFSKFIMKNRCCVTCRIHNWGFLMMFTPFLWLPSFYTLSLLGMAILIFLRWEYAVWRYPERFSDRTNASLQCRNCTDRLCVYKRKHHTVSKQSAEQPIYK